MLRSSLFRLFVVTTLAVVCGSLSAAERPPNIVYVLCDDLGYGDVKCLNPDGKIATPHIDRLAEAGITFTDAHSGSGVCSPTRYGIMTGRYAWRSKLQSGVLGGLSPRLIEPGRKTVASFLQEHGYHTACIGKWHLGMDWVKKPGKEVSELNIEPLAQNRNVEYDQPIANGPNSVGFDYYYGISASLDMVPYTFLENDRVTVNPTEEASYEMMFGRPKAHTRKGPAAPGFHAEQVLPRLTEKAVEYIGARAAEAKTGKPFFLYLPLASPHTPTLPTKEWQGKSGLNPYADFVMQTDDTLGRVLAALDEHSLADSTIVIFTSDNGCSPQADFPELLAKKHSPSHVFRGMKADLYEGGHRVPFIVRRPDKIAAGRKVAQPICHTDLFATVAELIGEKLPDGAAEDSFSWAGLIAAEPRPSERTNVVHHSVNGSFAIRAGDWKLCFAPGSGGWSAPTPGKAPADAPQVQLFNLAEDIGEKHNVQGKHPEIVNKMSSLMTDLIDNGRSTPGPAQKNAVPVKLWKEERK